MQKKDLTGPGKLTGILPVEAVSDSSMGTKSNGEFQVAKATVPKMLNLKRHVEVPKGKVLDEQAFQDFVKAVKAGGDITEKVGAVLQKSYANEVRRAQAMLAVADGHGHHLVRDETTAKVRARSLGAWLLAERNSEKHLMVACEDELLVWTSYL